MHKITSRAICFALLLPACLDGDDPPTGEATAELRVKPPRLIQAGHDLLLLAVTEDNHAVYQDGQVVYATELTEGAPRRFVTDVPGDSIAFPLQVGKVVFLWTAPQRHLPGFGVSPLVLWTAEDGGRLISPQSAVGLVATAASPDSRQIVFTTRVTADGLRGDLVHARTEDALAPTTLLSNIILDFPANRCRPLAGFGGTGAAAFPVAAYCAGTDTTATLSTWPGGVKTDLIAGIATPMPFTLEANPQGTKFLVNLASRQVATVTTTGAVTIVDPVAGVRGFVTDVGAVAYTTPAVGGLELKLARPGHAPQSLGLAPRLFANRYNRGGYYKSRTSSADGRSALFASTLDAATGRSNMKLLDLTTGTVTTLASGNRTIVSNEIFTSDSRYAFFLSFDDPDGLGALYAGNHAGARQLSFGDDVFDALRAAGSDISYNQHPVFDPERLFLLSTADLFVADAGNPCVPPRLVSAQANLFYLPSDDRRTLVFASEHEPAGAGLYQADSRASVRRQPCAH